MLAPAERCSLALSSLWGFFSHGSFHPFCFSPCTQSPPTRTSVPPPPPCHSLTPRPVKFSSSFLRHKIPVLLKKASPLCTQTQSNPAPAPPRPLHSKPGAQALRPTKGKERGLSQVGTEKDKSFISHNTQCCVTNYYSDGKLAFSTSPFSCFPWATALYSLDYL